MTKQEYNKNYYAEHKEEMKAAKKAWYEANPHRYRDHNLRKYGVSLEWFEEQLKAQDGKCAICKNPPSGKGKINEILHVDHHHASGKVRKLLCSNCNKLIGLAKENPETLRAAAVYLETE